MLVSLNLSPRRSKVSKKNSISIIKTSWLEHSVQISSIRDAVFIQEQAVPKNIEMDGKDSECIHFLMSYDDNPIGTARIKMSGKIERVSILKPNRNKGLGSKLMSFIIDAAKENRFERIYLHSQMESIGFYKNLGFIEEGDVFQEAGIDHVLMELKNE
ncbi:MAG: GNAT family N-acetyltransferase [Gammaproteobacteria bacterium]|nr:GNAT family N-acetyltransferase [Gammaproteobacteria bacterium]OUT94354.1 MAG: hypothetical protein CBB96_06435 [Gammaproteobacteria bacterium TMED36]